MPDLSFCRRLFSTSVLALIVSSAIVSAPYAQAQQAPQSSPSAPQAAPEAKPANDNQQTTAVQTGLPVIKTQQGVSSFQLANGLEVVVIPDHRAPVVTQMVWYRVGAADEHEGVSGIAHFLEHLMFKGTSTHKAGEFSASVAAIGGQENAFTSSDYTAYYQQVSPDALEKMMAFESDRMANLVLSDEVIVPERDVILEERRMRVDSNPGAMLGEEMNAVSYYNHPYRRPIIGWQQEMEKLSLNDALTFYQRYYTPNNAILVVAGDVTPERVRELSLKTYGTLPQRAEVAPRIRPQEPEKYTARVVTLHDSRVTQPSFRTQWLVPSYANAKAMGREKDAAALDLLGEILGGSIRSRLYQSLIVQQGIAASAGAYYAGDALDDGEFTLYGAPRGDATLEQVQQAVNDEVNRLIKDGVSDTELSQACNRFLKSVIFARDSQTGMARIYGSSLAVGQSVDDVLQWPDRIRAVTAAEVQDVAKRYLQPQIAVTGYLLPPKEATQKTAKESDSKSDAASNAPAGTAKVSAPQSEVKK